MRMVADVIARLPSPEMPALPAPRYSSLSANHLKVVNRVALAVASMKDHMTDEGWQLMQALEHGGYGLVGHGIYPDDRPSRLDATDVRWVVDELKPSVVVVQDKREWEGLTADRSRDPAMRFTNVEALRDHPEIFKLTVLKDAQHSPEYHRQSADEIGCHAHIVYYNTRVVKHLAPYVRAEHLIRTYHTIDAALVPPFTTSGRADRAVLSGAISAAYPLRQRLVRDRGHLRRMDILPHPGYHRRGCATPAYLKTLSWYKVAVCTSSVYGYALRKIIEATACGCVVVTDLPLDEHLPHIDGNLVRVSPDISTPALHAVLTDLLASYNPERQEEYAARAKSYYDYRAAGVRLAKDIEDMRRTYKGDVP